MHQPGPAPQGPAPIPLAADDALMAGKARRGVRSKIMLGIGAAFVVGFIVMDDKPVQRRADDTQKAEEMDPAAMIRSMKDRAGSVETPKKDAAVAVPIQSPVGSAPQKSQEVAEREKLDKDALSSGMASSGGLALVQQDSAAQIGQPPKKAVSTFDQEVERIDQRLAALPEQQQALQDRAGLQAAQLAQSLQAQERAVQQVPRRAEINQQFLNGAGNFQNQPVKLERPLSPLTVHQGTLVRATLLTALNSQLPGGVQAMVISDVYDTITGRNLLIPKGSRLIGQYSSDTATGQTRILFAFQRLIRPDGSWVNLAGSVGADGDGASGVPGDQVNGFFRQFGTALLVSAASVLFANKDQNVSVTVNAAGSSQTSGTVLGQAVNTIVQQMIARNQAVANSLTREAGYEFFVIASRDMIFEDFSQSPALLNQPTLIRRP